MFRTTRTLYCAGGAGARWVTVRPSANVTETKRPPGEPSRIGRAVTLTLSPALSVLDFQPARSRNDGAVISSDQVSMLPLSLGTSRSIHAWGLPQRNSLTVPLSVTDLV